MFIIASVSSRLAVEPGLFDRVPGGAGIGAGHADRRSLTRLCRRAGTQRALGTYGADRLGELRVGRSARRAARRGQLAAGLLRQRPDRRRAAGHLVRCCRSARGAGAARPAGAVTATAGSPCSCWPWPGRRHAAGHAQPCCWPRPRWSDRVHRPGAQGPAPLLDLALLKDRGHRQRRPHADRGRRLQHRPGPVLTTLYLPRTPAQPSARPACASCRQAAGVSPLARRVSPDG